MLVGQGIFVFPVFFVGFLVGVVPWSDFLSQDYFYWDLRFSVHIRALDLQTDELSCALDALKKD